MTKALSFCTHLVFTLLLCYGLGTLVPTDSLMLKPLDIRHAAGILTSSLIHDSLEHLFYNSLALTLFSFFLIKDNQISNPLKDIVVLIIMSNLIVFFFGNTNYYYLGSSNLVYALGGYALGALIINQRLIQVIPIALLSGMLLTGLDFHMKGISYISHYLGVISGLGLYIYRYIFIKNQLNQT